MPLNEKDERPHPVLGMSGWRLEVCVRLACLAGVSASLLSSAVKSTVSTRLRLPDWSGVFALLPFGDLGAMVNELASPEDLRSD